MMVLLCFVYICRYIAPLLLCCHLTDSLYARQLNEEIIFFFSIYFFIFEHFTIYQQKTDDFLFEPSLHYVVFIFLFHFVLYFNAFVPHLFGTIYSSVHLKLYKLKRNIYDKFETFFFMFHYARKMVIEKNLN